MKKMLLALAVLGLAIGLKADASVNSPYGPFVGVNGGVLRQGSAVQIGEYPKEQACTSMILATAAVNITAGDPLVWAGTVGPVSVSRTTTAGDTMFAGIALSTTTYGNQVQVCLAGVVSANVAQTTTYGQKFITSGTAGKLTASATVAEASYTGLSGTAIAFQALEAKAYSSSTPYVIGRILGR